MMRALLFMLIALPAAAQQTQAPPAEPKKEAERRPLNLRLDNPSSFATIAPEEKTPPKSLPSLGGDARRIIEQPGAGTRGDPIPKDTSPVGK